MKERPILFNAEMVRAVLSGAKTQTRRVCHEDVVGPAGEPWHAIVRKTCKYKGGERRMGMECAPCPYGQPGDRLWVRETWSIDPSEGDVTYEADGTTSRFLDLGPQVILRKPGKHPSIFMPRALSRITLEVTDVRVERVQDISEYEACREGALRVDTDSVRPGYMALAKAARDANKKPPLGPGAGERFRWLWDSINAKRGYSWDTNPWVWAVSFRKIA